MSVWSVAALEEAGGMILGPERLRILRKMREIREEMELEEADTDRLVQEYQELLQRLLAP